MLETMLSEDKYVYLCPKCNFLASVGGDTDKIHQCPKCKSIMHNTHITTDMWNAKTKEERIALVKKEQRAIIEKNSANDNSLLFSELSNIDSNLKIMTSKINTIKNILMFYFVITLLGMFLMFVNSAS